VTVAVLVVGELRDGRVAPPTLEALTAGRAVAAAGEGVALLLVGGGARAAAADVAPLGATRLLVRDDPRLDSAPVAAVAAVVAHVATALSVRTVLVGGSTFGRDLTGRLAVRWEALATTGVSDLVRDGSALQARRPVFGGRATETVRLDGPRTVVALRGHAFAPATPSGTTTPVEDAPPFEVPAALLAARRLAVEATASGSGPGLTDAAIVVAGGRGLRSAENFRLVEELAAAFGAAVGASRAVTDAGWRSSSFQVGQTGRSVSPQLYVAVGISGAIQHLVGMVSSRVIVAINSDPTAPIFKVADYGIVGDLFQIVPALTEQVRQARGG